MIDEAAMTKDKLSKAEITLSTEVLQFAFKLVGISIEQVKALICITPLTRQFAQTFVSIIRFTGVLSRHLYLFFMPLRRTIAVLFSALVSDSF